MTGHVAARVSANAGPGIVVAIKLDQAVSNVILRASRDAAQGQTAPQITPAKQPASH